MASRKRKLQEDATHFDSAGNAEDAIKEFALHLALRISAANRLKLTKVRVDMIPMNTALTLTDILTEAIDAKTRQRNLSVSRSGTRSR